MINDLILNYIFIFVFLELYEISWQKAPSIMGMIIRMNKYYSKNVLLFLIMQPTFYFAVCFAILCDYDIFAMIFLLLKSADVVTKILLIEQIFTKKRLTHEMSLILLSPIDSYLPYMGLIIYPVLIALAV
jgi:hypothetical protein